MLERNNMYAVYRIRIIFSDPNKFLTSIKFRDIDYVAGQPRDIFLAGDQSAGAGLPGIRLGLNIGSLSLQEKSRTCNYIQASFKNKFCLQVLSRHPSQLTRILSSTWGHASSSAAGWNDIWRLGMRMWVKGLFKHALNLGNMAKNNLGPDESFSPPCLAQDKVTDFRDGLTCHAGLLDSTLLRHVAQRCLQFGAIKLLQTLVHSQLFNWPDKETAYRKPQKTCLTNTGILEILAK